MEGKKERMKQAMKNNSVNLTVEELHEFIMTEVAHFGFHNGVKAEIVRLPGYYGFRKRLQKFLLEKGLLQAVVAEATGLKSRSLADIRKGKPRRS